jgi:hypothetical protein
VGVLIVVLVGQLHRSPFSTKPDLKRAEFTQDRASLNDIEYMFSDFSGWLRALGSCSEAFIWRHGWVGQIVVGMLVQDPNERLSVIDAAIIMDNGLRSRRSIQNAFQEVRSLQSALAKKPAPTTKPPPSTDGEQGKQERQQQQQQQQLKLDKRGRPLPKKIQQDTEPFRSLEGIINILLNGSCNCVFENRGGKKGAFNAGVPYGEIVGYRNRSDKDRWDIFVPGFEVTRFQTGGVQYRIKRVLGVVLIKGGNHKIAVVIRGMEPNAAKVEQDVSHFMDSYSRYHRTTPRDRMRYLQLDEIL